MSTIVRMAQGSPEWHEHRRRYRNASETPAVIGVSPWMTPYQLWQLKLGLVEPVVTPAMKHGSDLEPVARAAYERQTGRVMQPLVVVEGRGLRLETPTTRLRQDLATDYAGEMRAVTQPALVLHGGDDLNVPVADALRSYATLREAGNDDVELAVLPGLEHYFCPTPADPQQRIWERITRESIFPPMAAEALDTIARWARRALADD